MNVAQANVRLVCCLHSIQQSDFHLVACTQPVHRLCCIIVICWLLLYCCHCHFILPLFQYYYFVDVCVCVFFLQFYFSHAATSNLLPDFGTFSTKVMCEQVNASKMWRHLIFLDFFSVSFDHPNRIEWSSKMSAALNRFGKRRNLSNTVVAVTITISIPIFTFKWKCVKIDFVDSVRIRICIDWFGELEIHMKTNK